MFHYLFRAVLHYNTAVMKRSGLLITILILFIVGCQAETAVTDPTTSPPTATTAVITTDPTEPPAPEEPTAVPTEPVATVESVVEEGGVVEETAVATEAAPTEIVLQTGRTEEGAYYLGDPNAPIRLIDYADFL